MLGIFIYHYNKSTIRYIQKKEEEIHQSACETTSENAKVTFTVHDEVLEKIRKWLNIWIHEVMAHFKI